MVDSNSLQSFEKSLFYVGLDKAYGVEINSDWSVWKQWRQFGRHPKKLALGREKRFIGSQVVTQHHHFVF